MGMNNEMELEEGDKNLRETTKMAADNEQKLDEITRKLGVQEDESKRALERAELAEGKLKDVETELETIGENMKQLEISAEKATEREEKLKDKILNLMDRFKVAEARYEYGESNITKLNHKLMILRMKSTEKSSRSKSVLMSLATPSMTCWQTTKMLLNFEQYSSSNGQLSIIRTFSLIHSIFIQMYSLESQLYPETNEDQIFS